MTTTDVIEQHDPGGWPDVTASEPADHRALLAVAVAAVGTDLAIRSGVTGIAGALLPALVAGGLLGSGRVTNRRAWPVVLAAPALGMWLAARSSGWLLACDVAAAGALLSMGASLAKRGDPLDLTIPGLLGRGVHAVTHGILAVGFVFSAFGRSDRRSDVTTAVLRGALLATPLVVVLGVLLGAADPVFASFFRVPRDLGDLLVHLVLLGIGGWGASGLLRLASGVPYDVHTTSTGRLGRVEAVTILSGLVAVFAAFTVSQLVAAIGGADYVRRTAGLSYADYARSGFFQLLAVAAITLAALVVLRASVEHRDDRLFVLLSEAAVALTLVVVAGAVRRLGLYEDAYGLTRLRLWSLLFALWIGVVFLLFGVSVTGRVRADKAWFVPAATALALVALFALNAVNPEALIVRRNVERFGGTDRLDVDHLLVLSDDAVPELLRSRSRMTAPQARLVEEFVCAGERQATGGLWAFNASRDAAIEARNQSC